jgi:hypothetical protein
MIIKHKMSQVQIAKIRKGDIITLFLETSANKSSEVRVEVVEIVSDKERCAGCGCKISEESGREVFGRQIFCNYCFKKRKEKQSEITKASAKLRKKTKAYWS